MAIQFYLTPEDGVIICARREALIYPYTTDGWTDLRLGVYLSLTNSTANNDQTLLSESRAWVDGKDRFYIGFKNNSNDNAPFTAGVTFAGITNKKAADTASNSKVDPSTGGTATTGTTYWRAYLDGGSLGTRFIEGTTITNASSDLTTPIGSGLFLQQTGAAGYAALQIVRLTRAASGDLTVKLNIEGGASINFDYSSTPTIERIREMVGGATFVESAGVTLAAVPDALYFYWPYARSRLRIHALVLEKYS